MNTTETKIEVKTIDVNAKEWFDKVNGNSYFAANVTLNYGMEDFKNIILPFQYGYGDSYRYAAAKKLHELGFTNYDNLYQIQETGVIVRSNIQRNCKQRELKNI
jgi:hypothetical protein